MSVCLYKNIVCSLSRAVRDVYSQISAFTVIVVEFYQPGPSWIKLLTHCFGSGWNGLSLQVLHGLFLDCAYTFMVSRALILLIFLSFPLIRVWGWFWKLSDGLLQNERSMQPRRWIAITLMIFYLFIQHYQQVKILCLLYILLNDQISARLTPWSVSAVLCV